MPENIFVDVAAPAVASIPMWLEYLSAISGPVAGIIALFIAFYSNRRTQERFEKQVRQEAKLDERADERQQAEWSRRDREAARQRQEFGDAAYEGILQELEVIALQTRQIYQNIGEVTMQSPESRLLEFVRPVMDNIGARVTELPPRVLGAICENEARFKARANALNAALKSGFKTSVAECNVALLQACGAYLADLQEIEKGSKVSPEEALESIGITLPKAGRKI